MNILYKNLLREFDKFSLLKRILFARICNRSGIYFGQPPIIAYILDHDGCTQKDIADFLKVTPASIALSTKRLQKNGYIQKQPDEKNLRCNRLHLTPLGEKVIHEWKSGLDEVTEKMFAGFTDEERGKFTELLQAGFIDSFRHFYPDKTGEYSWWSYIRNARATNAGWRIDYFVVSEKLKDRMSGASIHQEIFGSDHCPVELVLE